MLEKERLAAASLYSADPQRVQVWTVPGAGHTQGLSTAPAEWERRVVGFLDSRIR